MILFLKIWQYFETPQNRIKDKQTETEGVLIEHAWTFIKINKKPPTALGRLVPPKHILTAFTY